MTATAQNVSEFGFSQTRIFQHKDRIKDYDLTRENTSQAKPVFSHIIRSERFNYPSKYLSIQRPRFQETTCSASNFENLLSTLKFDLL